jgi:IS66 Orf2 like protein
MIVGPVNLPRGEIEHSGTIPLWDSDGFLIVYKRLEKGTFRFPAPSDAEATGVAVNATDLIMLLDGVDLQSVKRRPRYVRDPASLADFSGSAP